MKTSVPVIILTCLLGGSQQLHLAQDGGYRDIVVKISDNLDMRKCSDIISGIKELFDLSSPALSQAVGQSVHFSSVTVIIPSSWPSQVCGVSAVTSSVPASSRSGDILVTNSDVYHGYYPHTQQSGGCGSPGDRILIPHTFLTTSNVTAREARTFTHLWAKYRYGIFDETGFSDDKLYPSYYRKDGDIFPTVTHNGVLAGSWLRNGEECQPGVAPVAPDGDCLFVPDLRQSSGLTCSLGSGLQLETNTAYCNSTVPLLPTKHGVVCQGRSAMEVIKSHSDFANGSIRQALDTRTELRVVREPVRKYVLALETSAYMADSDSWTWLTKAAHKLIRQDLPVNSYLAVLTFSGEVKVEHDLVQVDSDSVRGELADSIPGRYHLSSQYSPGCLSCLLSATRDTVLAGDTSGAHLIIITSAHTQPSERDVISGILEDNPLTISSIIIPSHNTNQLNTAFYDVISQNSAGRSFKLSQTGYGIDLLMALNSAFSEVLRSENIDSTEHAEVVHASEHYSNSEDNESSGVFIIDESLGRDTIFGIYVQDEEDHLIKSVRFEDSDGNQYGPFTKMSSSLDPFNIKTINYVGEEPPFGNAQKLGTQWRYSIKWSQYGSGSSISKNIVTVSSKPRTRDLNGVVRVNVWTSPVLEGEEVRVFASVELATVPIINATVTLNVEVENSNGTVFILVPVNMKDDGLAEPDMTAYDGIYSAFLPSYPADGRYSLSVDVTTKSDSLTFPPGEILSRHSPCCGSSTRPPPHKLIRTLAFSRHVPGPVLHLSRTRDRREQQGWPARVSDLSVRSDNSGVLTAVWSHADNSVTGFKFVFSPSLADLIDGRAKPQVLRELENTDRDLETNTAELQFSLYGRDYYIGVLAVSPTGRLSLMSNIVQVYQESPPVQTEPNTGTARYDLMQPVSDRDWIMVAVVCAIFAVLLCVTVVMTGYLCWYKHKRNRAKVSTGSSSSDVAVVSSGSSDQTDATSFDLDMKTLCPSTETPPPGYDLSLATPRQGPGSRVTPIYWSASQLLSKLDTDPASLYHEGVPSAVSLYHEGVPGGIPDEFCVTVSDLNYGVTPSGHRTYSDCSLGLSDCEVRQQDKMQDKMPPPVFPKPKNITQV